MFYNGGSSHHLKRYIDLHFGGKQINKSVLRSELLELILRNKTPPIYCNHYHSRDSSAGRALD
ncbi:hypothetical protein T12_12585 [Trichinella patagoniensis]|uniref:Uncharacterized protein n=1 Tax=Trichinella patagoniensis TaxID=990121 RepID=A0A0V0ZSB4_9BILA|nr:hypothetical protein T12_12585 [Trichinella patagoniensis]